MSALKGMMYVSNSIMQGFNCDSKNIPESLPMYTGIFVALYLITDDDTTCRRVAWIYLAEVYSIVIYICTGF